MFEVGVSAIQGTRDYQEDSFIVTDPIGSTEDFSNLDQILLLVADGVGGETAGAVASQIVGQVSAEFIQNSYSSLKLSEDGLEAMQLITALFEQLVVEINARLIETLKQFPEYSGMATTLVLVLIIHNRVYWLSIGDSHLYRISQGELSKLNADHSMASVLDQQVLDGTLSQEEALLHPERNYLLSYLDGGPVNAIDICSQSVEMEDKDIIVLSSDGLNTLSVAEILIEVERQESAQSIAQGLTNQVQAASLDNQDNTTVLVFRSISSK